MELVCVTSSFQSIPFHNIAKDIAKDFIKKNFQQVALIGFNIKKRKFVFERLHVKMFEWKESNFGKMWKFS